MEYYHNMKYIYQKIDHMISKTYPNYGYVEKYCFCEYILMINNYLLPSDDEIIELYDLVQLQLDK